MKRPPDEPWLPGVLFVLALLGAASKAADAPRPSFTPSIRTPLARFVYSPSTNSFFVAGTNVLLELDSSSLRETGRVETGPRLDSASCHASGCSEGQANASRAMADNVNKVLVLDGEGGHLIACGSLSQGACQRFSVRGHLQGGAEFIPVPVAANDNSSSTFAFVGPQRYNRWGHGDVLYVGTTFTHHGDFRHDVPAVAARNLHDLSFAEYSFSKQSLLRIDVKYRDRFLVNYAYGFNSTDHAYFVIVQKRSHVAGDEERGHVTRLARTCVSDPNFDTYAEVTLECTDGDGRVLDILTAAALHEPLVGEPVLYGAFSDTMTSPKKGRTKSGVCSFPLSTIERLFEENIHHCLNGSMSDRNLDYVSGPILEGKCPAASESRGNIRDFCKVGIKISGKHPIRSTVEWWLRDRVRSLATDDERGQVVLLAGTERGKIFQGTVPNDQARQAKVTQLRQFNVRSGPVLQLMAMDEKFVFLTPTQAGMFPLAEECSEARSCQSCADLPSPYCRWCPRSSTCAADCGAGQPEATECVHIDRISPPEMTKDLFGKEVFVHMSGLPKSGELSCSFSDVFISPAKRFDGGLSCAAPPFHDVADLENVELSVQMSNSSLAAAAMPVINCARASHSCESCVSLSHACRWCHGQSACLHHSDNSGCPSNELANTCPLISQREIRVPDNHPAQVEVDFAYLPAHFRTSRLFCMVEVEGAKMKVPAHVNGRVVVCERRRYSYIAEEPNLEVEAQIVTEAGLVLDSTNITLFKCGVMGTYRQIGDCSLCLRSAQSHGCAWCGSKCVYAQDCPPQKATSRCPKPEIYFVSPTRGPLEGGTTITLDGINLPAKSSRKISVKLGGKECRSVDNGDSEEITCVTPAAQYEQTVSIDVETEEGLKSRATVGFQYADFDVQSASPSLGPLSGGVSLSVSGHNLDIGSEHAVFVDDVPCHIHNLSRARGNLVCRLSAAPRPMTARNLTVRIDGGVRSVPFAFEFLPDPVVLSVKPLQSYFSGGRPVAVHGKYFSGLTEARMLVYEDDSAEPAAETECQIHSDRLMECPSPALTILDGDDLQPRVVSVGLKAGNVTRLLRLSEGFPRVSSDMEYFPDPEYFNVSSGYTIYDSELLVIEGHHLAAANDVTDVQVHVGGASCNVTSITSSQLLCVPPDSNIVPAAARLLVTASHNLKFDLGPVAYQDGESGDVLPEIVGAIGAAAAVLIFLAVVILIILKHKSSEVEREYKRIQIQMDLLEHNVRSECKQAFAELQTDMTGLAVDMETAGIPIYPRKTFLVKMFFPGVHDHPVILPEFEMWPPNGMNSPSQGGFTLQQVEELLLNKWFLLALVELIENQLNVSVKERINFASLVSVVLSTRMAYFSDVLKSLLDAFLNNAMNSRHADSTFRRSDSVVEKMLNNWLSICLYDYISDEVGPPLFLLSKAIKCQVEKGPVDALTHEAKYSLSEAGLLRQSCEYAPVSCLVLQRELDEAYECKVLDADSVTQVKSKILDAVYKNTPFSLRPRVEEVDLEWQCGQDAHVILQDVDLTTEADPDGCYKRVNTLRHYGIKNKAVVSLVPKQFQTGKPESPYRSKELGLYHLRIPTAKSGNNSSSAPSTSSTNSSSSRSSSSGGGHYATVSRGGNGTIPEVYLTRLLATKGTLKKFVDDFVAATTRAEGRFPSSLKWLFDRLDEASSRRHGFAQSLELSHAWKFNSVYRGLWAQLLRAPDLAYDVERTPAMENNLSVVAQALQSSGAGAFNAGSPVGREAPYHKLLFSREIGEYRCRLQDFFSTVRRLPAPTDFEFDCHMGQLSARHQGLFNSAAALQELSIYVGAHAQRLCDISPAAARAVRDVRAGGGQTQIC